MLKITLFIVIIAKNRTLKTQRASAPYRESTQPESNPLAERYLLIESKPNAPGINLNIY